GKWAPSGTRGGPIRPGRHNASKSAAPPTSGGRTIGRVVRALTRLRPRYSTLAWTRARGTPRASAAAVAERDVTSDRRRAWPASFEVSSRQAVDQGAFHNRPPRGRAKSAAATMATTTGTAGGGSRAAAADRS